MRVLVSLLLLAACAAPLAADDTQYMDYEVYEMQLWGLADPPSMQCCIANSLNLCVNVNDTACDDSGTCYCCPNGGGITANFTGGNTSCVCGYRQTCNDVKCKNRM